MTYSLNDEIQKIKNSILQILKEVKTPVAAFDADGTLWPTDMGETFFNYQIENRVIGDLPENPWQYYQDLKDQEPKKAYLWLAQLNQGYSIGEVRQWASLALKADKDFRIFDEQKEVISFLHQNGVAVYVVTASVKWAVEPAAALLNIPQENVIGIETEIKEGLVTDFQAGPITYRQGKVDALLEKTKGVPPFFVSGNTMGDFKLLESSSHLRLSVASAPKGHENYETEQKIAKHSKENSWFSLNYLA